MLRTKTAVAGVGISANVFSFGIGENVFGICTAAALPKAFLLERASRKMPFVGRHLSPWFHAGSLLMSRHKLLLNFRRFGAVCALFDIVVTEPSPDRLSKSTTTAPTWSSYCRAEDSRSCRSRSGM